MAYTRLEDWQVNSERISNCPVGPVMVDGLQMWGQVLHLFVSHGELPLEFLLLLVVLKRERTRWSPMVLSLRKAVSGRFWNMVEISGSFWMILKLLSSTLLIGKLWGW